MPTEDHEDEIGKIAKYSSLSEAQRKENLQQIRRQQERRAKEAQQLESDAGFDVATLRKAATAYSEARLPDDRNRVIRRILELVPNDPSAIYYNAKYNVATYREQLTLKAHLEEMVTEYSRLYEFPEFVSSADASIEYILYECDEHERAIPYQQKLYDSGTMSIANKLLHSLYECGRYEEALKVCRSETFGGLSPENRARYANLLEMIGKTRLARTIRFNLDFSVFILEHHENKAPTPELVQKEKQLSRYEREVLQTLYHARENKKNYDQALAEMNDPVFSRRLDPRTFNMEEIKRLEESALNKLGVSAADYVSYLRERSEHRAAVAKDFDQKRQKLLREKYPDLLEPDETIDEEDWVDRW